MNAALSAAGWSVAMPAVLDLRSRKLLPKMLPPDLKSLLLKELKVLPVLLKMLRVFAVLLKMRPQLLPKRPLPRVPPPREAPPSKDLLSSAEHAQKYSTGAGKPSRARQNSFAYSTSVVTASAFAAGTSYRRLCRSRAQRSLAANATLDAAHWITTSGASSRRAACERESQSTQQE